MSGYVRIHRSLIGHPAFRNDAEAMAFAWMIAKASWRDVRVRYKGHSVNLKRGQLAISVRDMAFDLDRDKGWIERLWKRLKSEAMVETRSETGVTVVTICNYDEYQSTEEASETAPKTQRKTHARQTQDTEQGREEGKKEGSEAKASSPRPWALPVGVSLQVWGDLLSNRKKKRLNNTETSWKAFNDDLTRIAAQTGIPPPELIRLCAAKGWGAIYDPRAEDDRRTHTMGRNQPADGLSSTARAAIAVFGR